MGEPFVTDIPERRAAVSIEVFMKLEAVAAKRWLLFPKLKLS